MCGRGAGGGQRTRLTNTHCTHSMTHTTGHCSTGLPLRKGFQMNRYTRPSFTNACPAAAHALLLAAAATPPSTPSLPALASTAPAAPVPTIKVLQPSLPVSFCNCLHFTNHTTTMTSPNSASAALSDAPGAPVARPPPRCADAFCCRGAERHGVRVHSDGRPRHGR